MAEPVRTAIHKVSARETELWVFEQIEKFGSELNLGPLLDNARSFEDCEIGILRLQ